MDADWSGSDLDFWLIRSRTQEKKSDPGPDKRTRIRNTALVLSVCLPLKGSWLKIPRLCAGSAFPGQRAFRLVTRHNILTSHLVGVQLSSNFSYISLLTGTGTEPVLIFFSPVILF